MLWLEEVQGDAALAWVHARNAEARAALQQHPRFQAMRTGLQAILDSPHKIAQLTRRGDWFYNLWRDAAHPRGLWRRCTLPSLCTPTPAWEPVLDLDALAAAEGENWVWAGATSLGPAHRHCVVQLSRGGADASVLRHFDLQARAFVADGFTLPEAKTEATWDDAEHLLVGTDTGPGSMTDSGYPRTVRRWRRGTPLADAPVVFEGAASDVSVSAWVHRGSGGSCRTVFSRAIDFYNSERFLRTPEGLRRIAIPADATLHFWRDLALLQLRSDWAPAGTRWQAGSLLAADAQALLQATGDADMPPMQALFTPTATRSLQGLGTTGSQVLLQVLDNVAGRIEACLPGADGWHTHSLPTPAFGSLALQTLHDDTLADDPLAEQFLLGCTGFLSPDTLLLGHTDGRALQTLQAMPAFFDASGLRVQQHWATSADGTRVPYFLVASGSLVRDSDRPTLLNGYGGFEISRLPMYAAGWGSAWLAQGGVLAVANIRGGGEFGPAWHQAAVGPHKHRSHDDFIAVAEHLVHSGVTRPQRLAIQGGSNGGLLVGAVMLRRPDLFGAVLCQVPLLDMRRYHRLLAGASWMAEYGNPDLPAQWAWIAPYSPYQRLQALPPGTVLPRLLVTTSTRDDRVHPGHARKFAALALAQGQPVLYLENTEGGHAGAADNRQRAELMALEYSFLWGALGEA